LGVATERGERGVKILTFSWGSPGGGGDEYRRRELSQREGRFSGEKPPEKGRAFPLSGKEGEGGGAAKKGRFRRLLRAGGGFGGNPGIGLLGCDICPPGERGGERGSRRGDGRLKETGAATTSPGTTRERGDTMQTG